MADERSGHMFFMPYSSLLSTTINISGLFPSHHLHDVGFPRCREFGDHLSSHSKARLMCGYASDLPSPVSRSPWIVYIRYMQLHVTASPCKTFLSLLLTVETRVSFENANI